MIDQVITLSLLVFLTITAITLVRTEGLLTMVMVFAVYSFLMATLFVVMDAPDVAFTEAAVGSGISTVLMLVTLSLTKTRYEKPVRKLQWRALVMVTAMGCAILYGISDIAAPGDGNAPVNVHVADHYIAHGQNETGVPNLVTAVLASYRGFDTLGETVVIFTAGIGVMLLLGRRRRPVTAEESA